MRTISLFIFYSMTILLFSCQKDEFKDNPQTGIEISGQTGSLCLEVGLSISVNEVESRLKSMPTIEDFSVTVYLANGTEVMSFENASDVPDTIVLEIGNYFVEAHSENDLPAAFENPYYFGVSDVFTINSNVQSAVQLNCELANSIVTVQYSDRVMDNFTDYKTCVSSTLDSLVFFKDETRKGYFQSSALDVRVELFYATAGGSDTSKILAGQIPEVFPNKHYEIYVDASIDAGMAFLNISLDSSALQVEAIQITDHSTPPPLGDIGYGDLLISEIMCDPSALSDTEGEWFEIYNNSGRVINVGGLILKRDDTNLHTIADSIDLEPGAYLVLEKTELATDASGYVYGSGILLPNTGAVLSIYNADTQSGPGELIFSVDYGAAGFPSGSGASISLSPVTMNAGDAVYGSSWCVSTSVYNTGDLGTPGAINDPCQ